ncbi:MAG: PEP-CTERM system histidine kinase PrsK [Pseudomonadales bacterium]|nr:PEP-CTERM system histidine kinase PrsK [Pseudomonadales bacterium]
METLLSINGIIGSIAYLIVAILYSLILRQQAIIFLPAFLFTAVWSLFSHQFFALDFAYLFFWSSCLLAVFVRRKQILLFSLQWFLTWSIPAISLIGIFSSILLPTTPLQIGLYLYLFICIGTLLITEQHIRNGSGLIKIIGIAVGTLLLFNLYICSMTLILDYIPQQIVHARSLANTVVGLTLCFAPLFGPRQTYQQLELSRPLVFTTTSLVLAGGILVFVSTLGYLLTLGNGEYASIIQPFFLFVAILLIGLNLGSNTQRAKIRVWVLKNFFQTKFDHNFEWRQLSDRLTPENNQEDFANIALHALLPIYHSNQGVCFIHKNNQYIAEHKVHVKHELNPVSDSKYPEFFHKMREDNWIYVCDAIDPEITKWNDLIPSEIKKIGPNLLILPLINNNLLLGFLVVSGDRAQVQEFNWEDLDLLRMVGKQVANFVGNQILSKQLIVTRQFEAYHQFTTFIMHDLKNLIAQQALVVENAARFSHNPEFVADAMQTIENSVKKMNQLLLRINQNNSTNLEQTLVEPVLLVDIIQAAVLKCKGKNPQPIFEPTLSSTAISATAIMADAPNLVMAFTHLLTNAQEACEQDGTINIYLSLLDDYDYIECRVIDNGTGMTQSFIEQRLFKPFDSTKKNQGMGIGAYQCKEIISNIDGEITVSSKIGEGSCFTITLPLYNKKEYNKKEYAQQECNQPGLSKNSPV